MVSNNILAVMVIGIIIVSLVRLVSTVNLYSQLDVPITGQPITQTGVTRVTLEQNIDIQLTQALTDFGILRNLIPAGSLVLESNRSCCGWKPGENCPSAVTAGGNWTSVTGCGVNGSVLDAGRVGMHTWQTDGSRSYGHPMVLNNTGTDVANVDISSSNDASFLGGTAALRDFAFWSMEEPPNACITHPPGVNDSFSSYVRFMGASRKQPLCKDLNWGPDAANPDSIALVFNLTIPFDATRAPLSTTITFTACRNADASPEGICP